MQTGELTKNDRMETSLKAVRDEMPSLADRERGSAAL